MNSPSVSVWKDAGWRAVAAAFALNGLLFGAWASRVPAFKDSFDLQPAMLGVLLLALAGGAIVAFPFAGVLSEKWGVERLTLRCAWAYAPALVLISLAPNSWILGIALFLFGIFHGAMDVAMNGWGARTEQRLETHTMPVFHAMFSLGAGIGAASGAAAASLGYMPKVHFVVVAGLGAVLAARTMLPARAASPATATAAASQPLFALPSSSLLLIGLIAFSTSMGEGAMADWSAVFLRIVAQATEAQAALGYAAFSTTMVLTRLAGGFIVDRFGPAKTARLSGMTALIGFAAVIGAPGLPVALAGFALIGVGYAIVMPIAFSRAANDPSMRPGPAIASVATLAYGGMLLGPPIVGFIAQFSSLRVSFAVLALLAGLTVLLAPGLRND
ncbi:MAG: MFS transporter [Granulosicoccus sp.]|nr:MFS transporter [Granulosicoccus sp.]